MNVSGSVLQWLILDLNYECVFNFLSILNLIENPIGDDHSAIQLSLQNNVPWFQDLRIPLKCKRIVALNSMCTMSLNLNLFTTIPAYMLYLNEA